MAKHNHRASSPAQTVPKTLVSDTQSVGVVNQALTRPETQSQNIGYARVSTEDQNLDLQQRALTRAGCTAIFKDQASGATTDRSGLAKALETLGEGDVLVVWKLDRLGRSLSHLIEVINQIGEKGAGFRSLSENIDTTTAGGRLVFHMMGALAEFERSLIAERTRAGLEAAKARGARLGRPAALSDEQIEDARTLIANGKSVSAVARSLKVGRSTLYRALNAGEAA